MTTDFHGGNSAWSDAIRPGAARRRSVAAFTMIEIAICLGVIAIALVAILGVLPTGVRVQRDNREDTIINQEGLLWVEAIRSGSRGLDYLTNYVDTITVSNVTQAKATLYYNPAGFVPQSPPANTALEPWLTNGQVVVGLLTYPKVTSDSSGNAVTNRVVARVRAISGSAAEKGRASRDFAFAYQLTSEVVPLNVTPPQFLVTNGLSGNVLQARLDLRREEANRLNNFEQLRLTLQGPLIPKGTGYDLFGTPKTFRTLISGWAPPVQVGNLVQPSVFVQQTIQ